MAEVDLRPMTLGEVLDRTFSLYKKHFWLFVGIMSFPPLAALMIQIVMVLAGISAVGATSTHSMTPGEAGGFAAGVFGSAMLIVVVSFVMYGAAEAATVFAVSDLYLGRSTSIRGAYGSVRYRLLGALGTIFLTGLIVGVGFILLIVPGIILLARTSLAVPVAMLEDQYAGSAVNRSMELTKGFAWSMLGIFALTWIIHILAAAVLQYPFVFLTLMSIKSHSTPLLFVILQDIATFVTSALVGPILTIALSLMYYNLRVRKEAFDLQHLMTSLGSAPPPATETPAAPAV
jgi:hypothetical protein